MSKTTITMEQLDENRTKLIQILKTVERPMDFKHIDLLIKRAKNISFNAGYVEYSLMGGRKFKINRTTGEFLNDKEAFQLEMQTIRLHNLGFKTNSIR